MQPFDLRQLFDYTAWANRRVWDCVMALPEDAFTRELSTGQPTLRDQCVHILEVEHWWPHFLYSGSLEFLPSAEYVTAADVRAAWDTVEANLRSYLPALEADLSRMVSPPIWNGAMEVTVWQGLFQVLEHSTDHRAQLLDSVRALGGPTVEQDFVGYLYERSQAASSGA